MSFCFGFLTNDHRLTQCAIGAFEDVLLRKEGAPSGWGLGYYQAEQPLIRKQPTPIEKDLNIAALSGNFRTKVIIGQVREATIGSRITENTQPFRFRNWMFCHCGTLDKFSEIKNDLLNSVPDFIRRNIRGSTDTECVFHLFLSFLNDTGKLDDPRISHDVVAQALSSTLAYVDRLSMDRGGTPSKSCGIITNGHFIAGVQHGLPLAVTRKAGYRCPDRDGKLVPANNLKAVLLTGGEPPSSDGWEEIGEGALVSIDSNLNIEHHSSPQ